MFEPITTVLAKIQARSLTVATALLGIAIFLPFFIHLQWITGPIVNAVLIIATVLVGLRLTMLVALVPSIMAMSSGLLPLPLAPVVPFIMLSNVILILIFDWLRDRNYWLGVILGGAIKFLFLYSMTHLVLVSLLGVDLAAKAAIMMSWPQFITVLIGGALAYGVLRFLKFMN